MANFQHVQRKREAEAEDRFMATLAERGADAEETRDAFRDLTISSARALRMIRETETRADQSAIRIARSLLFRSQERQPTILKTA